MRVTSAAPWPRLLPLLLLAAMIAVGFGIKTGEQAAAVARKADAAVVGSAIVQQIADNLDAEGRAKPGLAEAVLGFVRSLSDGVRRARR